MHNHTRKPNRPVETKVASLSSIGWSVFFSQLVIAFGFLIFGLTHMAFAARQYGAESVSVPYAQKVSVTINGELNWSQGTGTLRDTQNGRVYTLTDSEGIKALWDSGVRKVAVVGRVGKNNTFTVENVSAP